MLNAGKKGMEQLPPHRWDITAQIGEDGNDESHHRTKEMKNCLQERWKTQPGEATGWGELPEELLKDKSAEQFEFIF